MSLWSLLGWWKPLLVSRLPTSLEANIPVAPVSSKIVARRNNQCGVVLTENYEGMLLARESDAFIHP